MLGKSATLNAIINGFKERCIETDQLHLLTTIIVVDKDALRLLRTSKSRALAFGRNMATDHINSVKVG